MTTEDSVLLPAFVPEGIIAPFQRRGVKVLLYPIDRQLDPDWEFVEYELSHSKPKVAVIIHYFGLVKPVERFHALCRKHGALVIEDAAHVLPSGQARLGATGDFVLYSLPKMLGVPDGAPLVVRVPGSLQSELCAPGHYLHTWYVTKHMAVIALTTALRFLPGWKVGAFLRRVGGRLLNPYPTLMSFFQYPNRMSGLSAALVGHMDLVGQAQIRRGHVHRYQEALDPVKFERLPGVNTGDHGMFGFPVLVLNRPGLIRHLAQHGIRGVVFNNRWTYVPDDRQDVYRACLEVLEGHFVFPVAPHLSQADVERVIQVANAWSGE